MVNTAQFGLHGRKLISAANDGLCYLWNAVDRGNLKNEDIEGLWKKLIGSDASAAYQAFWEMHGRRDEVPALVGEKLSNAKQVLDSFEATKNLPVEQIEPRRQLIEKVLSTNPRALSSTGVRRAVALLAAISTDQSKEVLSQLASSGSVNATVRKEASATLNTLAR